MNIVHFLFYKPIGFNKLCMITILPYFVILFPFLNVRMLFGNNSTSILFYFQVLQHKFLLYFVFAFILFVGTECNSALSVLGHIRAIWVSISVWARHPEIKNYFRGFKIQFLISKHELSNVLLYFCKKVFYSLKPNEINI